jgi:hypothetical protein
MIRRLASVSPVLRRGLVVRANPVGLSLTTRGLQTSAPCFTEAKSDAGASKYQVVMAVRDANGKAGEIKEFVSEPQQLEQSELTDRQRERENDAYQLMFTCKVCKTPNSHTVSKQAYSHGTVLVECPGCKNRHLIADHLKVCFCCRVPVSLEFARAR